MSSVEVQIQDDGLVGVDSDEWRAGLAEGLVIS